jgi:hypothetical protein
MNNLDITERSILESERDELRLENLQLRCALEDAKHLFTILKYLPEWLFVDMAHVLEYGQDTHKPEEWKNHDSDWHRDRAAHHVYWGYMIDEDTGVLQDIHAAIRCLMAAAREKDND